MLKKILVATVAVMFFSIPPLGWAGYEGYYQPFDAQLVGDSLYVLYSERGDSTIDANNFVGVWSREDEGSEWVLDHKLLGGEISFAHTLNFSKNLEMGIIADSDNHRIVTAKRNGEIVKEYPIGYVNDAEVNDAGNKIISSAGSTLIEINIATGEQKKIPLPGGTEVHDCDLLPSGNIMYVNSSGGMEEVVEMNKDNDVVWSHQITSLTGWVRNAERLPSGMTLVADDEKIIVVTANHKEVLFFDSGDEAGQYNIHPTKEGLLIAMYDGACMLSRTGEVLWYVKLPREDTSSISSFERWRELFDIGYIR